MAQNLDGKYSIEIRTPAGQLLADLSGMARDRSFVLERNGSYNAEWKVDLDTIEEYARNINVDARTLFDEGRNEAILKRLGVPILGGQIEYTQADLGETKEVSVRLVGWLDLFKTRQTAIEKTFVSGTDIGAIAWGLVDESQLQTYGSYGIIQGTLQDCPDIPADVLFEFKNLKEALQELSARIDGFDFEFTWDKRFNVYYPRMGVARSEFELVYPGNVKNIKPSRDSSTIRNSGIIRGQGIGDGQLLTNSEDTDSQSIYKRREDIYDFSDIPDIDTLQALGDEQIRALKDPHEVVDIILDGNQEPFIGSYLLGDTVPVQVLNSRAYAYVTGNYRIDQISVAVDEEDNEVVTLKATK